MENEQIIEILGLLFMYGAVNYASGFTIKMFDKKWMITSIIITTGYIIITNSSNISNSL